MEIDSYINHLLANAFNDLLLKREDTQYKDLDTDSYDTQLYESDDSRGCDGEVFRDSEESRDSQESRQHLNINDLNSDCFFHLLQFFAFHELMKMRCVCRQWRDSINHLLEGKRKLQLIHCYGSKTYSIKLWHHKKSLIVMTNDANCIEVFSLVTGLCPNLNGIEFVCITFDEDLLQLMLQNYHDLHHLGFWHVLALSEVYIKLMIDFYGVHLLKLSFHECDFSEECLQHILQNCIHLQQLNISANAEINGGSLHLLPESISKLTLSQCESMNESTLKAIISGFGVNLTHLSISGMITDAMIRIICSHLHRLKSFLCSYACTRDYGCTTDHLSVIGLCTQLEKLSLQEVDAYYGSLDDRSLTSIMRGCANLTHLEIHVGSGEKLLVSDSSLACICDFCPLIRCLKIYYTEDISDKTLFSISKLKNLSTLELINLYKITDDGIKNVLEKCEELRKLWISFDAKSDLITNSTLIACIEMCRKRPRHEIEVDFFETSISVSFNTIIPHNMRLRVSWYRQTPEGRCYTEIKLPSKNNHLII